MRKADVIAHFKTGKATAEALGISPQAVSKWPEIVPEGMAYKLQVITAGHLRVDPAAYSHETNNAG